MIPPSVPSDPQGEAPLQPPRSPRQTRIGPEGHVTVFVADEQDDVAVDTHRWARLAESVLGAEGVRGEAELSILFVGEEPIAELNRRFLQGSGSTDVLAFPIDQDDAVPSSVVDPATTGPDRDFPSPSDLPLLLGDVVVCPAVAVRNAPDHAGTLDDELALLVVHGVLHVLGYDHADERGRVEMWGRERQLLEQFHGSLARDPWHEVPG